MTKRLLCTGHIAGQRLALQVAPGVTLHLSPSVNVASLCGIRTWLHEYRNARNAGADAGFAAAAADVVAYGVRYAVGLEWNEEEIQGDWRD